MNPKADTELAKQLRRLLSGPSSESALAGYFDHLDTKVLEISSSDDATRDQQRQDFEEELQIIYDEDVDHSRLQQFEIFLDALNHALPILTSTSLIVTWFDLLLRPALREPRLASTAVEHAKQLILHALATHEDSSKKVFNFRRRLLDLFLLDVLNESSGKDIFEWAELDETQRDKNSWWKNNLEDILVRYGMEQTKDFLTVLNDCFLFPGSRLQILTLLDSFIIQPSFLDISSVVLHHPLMSNILRSLQVDNSSSVCAVELAVLVKLLPVAAISAYDELKRILPCLFSILGRILCWQSRGGRSMQVNKVAYSDLLDYHDESLVSEMEKKEKEDDVENVKEDGQARLKLNDDLKWDRLERTFDMSTSSLPVPRQYFALLYYLFPCNITHFLRRPASYLIEKGVESPWTVGWDDALDDLQIRTAGSLLLRTHVLHPSVIWHDVTSELADPDRWSSYDVSRIVGECMMLDSNMASLARRGDTILSAHNSHSHESLSYTADGDATRMKTPTLRSSELGAPPSARQRKISLHDIIATSVALKSGADINISDKAPVWPSILFTPPPSSPLVYPSSPTSPGETAEELKLPLQISETIAGLQREVLLLRTELNFELWLKRENIRHIGRLHQDEVQTKGAELNQQRLQNRLREYRGQLFELQKELKQHQDQALKMKHKHVEWNAELSSKLNVLREEKKQWMTEANTLRSANVDLKAHLAAQSKLLADAQNKVFVLETQIKTDAPKVQRLRDYEKRVEQLTSMHRMWNKDIIMYNEQTKEMAELVSEHQKMKIRVEAYERSQGELQEAARTNLRRIQILEANLRASRKVVDSSRLSPQELLAAQAAERESLARNNKGLRSENAELRDELEEMRAMVEVLKAQITGTRGLVYPEV